MGDTKNGSPFLNQILWSKPNFDVVFCFQINIFDNIQCTLKIAVKGPRLSMQKYKKIWKLLVSYFFFIERYFDDFCHNVIQKVLNPLRVSTVKVLHQEGIGKVYRC